MPRSPESHKQSAVPVAQRTDARAHHHQPKQPISPLAPPTYFTVIGDYRTVVADTTVDVDADPELAPLTATVTFTPMLRSGDSILASKAVPRPTVFVPVPIVAHIDGDGRLKLRDEPAGQAENHAERKTLPTSGVQGVAYRTIDDGKVYRWDGSTYLEDLDYTPVRLLADTELLELKGPLFYRVTFTDVKFNGVAGFLSSFDFEAPDHDTTVNLVDVARRPGEVAVGVVRVGPTGVRLNEHGDVVFTIGGRDIPDPVKLKITSVGGDGAPTLSIAAVKSALTPYFDDLATTYSHKRIALGENTITGTVDEFNAALTDGDFALWGPVPADENDDGVEGTLAADDGGFWIYTRSGWHSLTWDVQGLIDQAQLDADAYTDEQIYEVRDELSREAETRANSDVDLSDRIEVAISGLMHGIAVLDFVTAPPVTAVDGDDYIVDKGATGIFGGQINTVASLVNGAWVFHTPDPQETHLNEKDNSLYTWNGTIWVKVGSVGKTQIGQEIHAAKVKAKLVGADEFAIADFEDTWNVKRIDFSTLQKLIADFYNDYSAQLTNKGIDLSLNNLRGTVAEFQAALTDGQFAIAEDTQDYADQGDRETLSDAQKYADDQDEVLVDALTRRLEALEDAPDPTVDLSDYLTADDLSDYIKTDDAKAYADDGDRDALTDAQAYADTQDDLLKDALTRRLESLEDTDLDLKDADVALSDRITAAVTGLEHEVSVLDIAAAPPAAPAEGALYIVGLTPTGAFAGHANALAAFAAGKWTFQAPNAKETHLNEADNQLWNWNGTAWVKVGTVAAPQPIEDQILAAANAFPADDDQIPFADVTALKLREITWGELKSGLNDYADSGDRDALTDAQTYADTADEILRDSLTPRIAALEGASLDLDAVKAGIRDEFDDKIDTRTYIDAQDTDTLASAQGYADLSDNELRDDLVQQMQDLHADIRSLVYDHVLPAAAVAAAAPFDPNVLTPIRQELQTLKLADANLLSDVQKKIDAAVSGLSHDVAVMGIVNAPPGTAPDDVVYIVGTTPTGVFAGHANQVAVKSGGVWSFSAPVSKETHLNEADGLLWTWNGTAWIKVTSAAVASTGVTGSAGGTATALTLWTGTKAQYDAITTKDPNCVYVVL